MTPYWDNGPVQLYQADARSIPLPDHSVHCVVTSPPYFGLRVYKDNDDRGIGLESTVEDYIGNLVDVFREVRRVLRDDGVAWLNLGDSYGDGGDRLGIPERVVLALRESSACWHGPRTRVIRVFASGDYLLENGGGDVRLARPDEVCR